MKIEFNTKSCKDLDLSEDMVLYLLSLYLNKNITKETIEKLRNTPLVILKEFNSEDAFYGINITKEGIDIIESIVVLKKDKKEEDDMERFSVLATKLQELFPKGKKPGTNCMWRDSHTIITKRLKAIYDKYDCNFTDDEAVEATKKYIDSFNGDYRFMQVLKYFLHKRNLITGEVSSQFLSYIENLGQEDVYNTNWMDEVR